MSPLTDTPAGRPFRIALITAGQSPRPPIVADLKAALPDSVRISEFGALDGLSDEEIDALRPAPGDICFRTRIGGGRAVMIGCDIVYAKFQQILSDLKSEEFDLAAIFCTGSFQPYPAFSSACRLIQSQLALENAVSMLVRAGHRIGVVQPFPGPFEDDMLGLATYQRQLSWLDTDNEDDWARVVSDCAECEVLVLNSLDFDEESALRLGRETGVPVILPRRVLASAIRLVLEVGQQSTTPVPADAAIEPLLQLLTPRERQVMWFMVDGLQSKQIAHRLEISPNTVSIHRASVLSKLGVPNTSTLTRLMLGRPARIGPATDGNAA